ncbi:MAG: 23S rRNA (uracil(1939)-C(5))-methyltransferase RlmD, partial [Clostridia bacterium]|nr:23S rRNA (uracil(1939)-C(5))-methyltransferase RlmD [Clostridia bacterium]
TVITDPPRAGCSKEFLVSCCTLAPKRIVYVSCNPETLARDCAFLTKNGYTVKKVVPVDMFPHTAHVECVCLIERKR